jgi:integrase/recombinase XerD
MARTTATARTRYEARKAKRRPGYDQTAEGYLAYMRKTGKRFRDSTETKYLPQIRAYLTYCRENDAQLTEQDEHFIEMEWFDLDDERFEAKYDRQPSSSYKRNRYHALKSYFEFLRRLRAVDVNPVDLIDAPIVEHGEVEWLDSEEDEAVADVDMDPLEEIVWGLARLAGLRISEIPSLRDEDVDVESGEIHIRDGKTRAAKRDVQILPRLYSAIEHWRAHRDDLYGDPPPSSPFVRTSRVLKDVPGRPAKPITTVYIDRIIKRVATRAEVRLHRDHAGAAIAIDKLGHNTTEVSAHTLRRTYGSDLLNRGVPIEVLSDQLGHARIGITQEAYARLLKKTVRRTVLAGVTGGVACSASATSSLKKQAGVLSKASAKKSAKQQLRELEALEAAIHRQKRALLAA